MQITTICRVILGHRNLFLALQEIGKARKTGSLTIHFGQGSINSLEWQQKQVEKGVWPFHTCTATETCIDKVQGL